MEEVSIYLAGKIQKAHEAPNETYWTEEDQEAIRKAMSPCRVHFLNPAIRTDDLSDQKSVFGRDMMQVFSADAVFVDARDRRGLGVGAEMMWAKFNRIPVVSLAPLGSHYNKAATSLLGVEVNSWVHPFIEGLSDQIVSSLEEAAAWLMGTLHEPSSKIKGSEYMREAMQYYLEKQYAQDVPMCTLAASNQVLQERFLSVSA